jgi:hypothetical protein
LYHDKLEIRKSKGQNNAFESQLLNALKRM